MKKLYLVTGLFLGLFNPTLFGMEQANKDSAVIIIKDSKGKEVAIMVDRSQQDNVEQKGWWKRLSKNKKIALGLSVITAICAGFDTYNCAFNGCPINYDLPAWLMSTLVGAPSGFAAAKITEDIKKRFKIVGGLVTCGALGTASVAIGLDVQTLGVGSIAYFASVLFKMK